MKILQNSNSVYIKRVFLDHSYIHLFTQCACMVQWQVFE